MFRLITSRPRKYEAVHEGQPRSGLGRHTTTSECHQLLQSAAGLRGSHLLEIALESAARSSTFKNTKFTEFDLSKVRDEVTSDRRKLKSTMTMDISNMKHVQVGAKTTHFEKVIEGDNMLTNLTKCGQQYSSGGEVSAQGKFIESGDPTCFTVQLE
ncbi:unnamed protein product [Mesocestoides corti]|uniref:Uncharacterized protein n=1 Tax=Mesocestoides corti TaxID=53468 RepID=A0A0R3UC99_MESCO|nr:unnamed protein product [Mesocestoides corti]